MVFKLLYPITNPLTGN